eukprot:9504102-Pyramimonas_sp.AAC.1
MTQLHEIESNPARQRGEGTSELQERPCRSNGNLCNQAGCASDVVLDALRLWCCVCAVLKAFP